VILDPLPESDQNLTSSRGSSNVHAYQVCRQPSTRSSVIMRTDGHTDTKTRTRIITIPDPPRDVKRDQMLEAKAEAEAKHLRPRSRPRPEPRSRGRGRSHNLEAEVEAEFNRPSQRPKLKRPNRTLDFTMKIYAMKTLCDH